MPTSGGSFFTSLYFYGLMVFLVMGIVIVFVIGFAMRSDDSLPLSPAKLKRARDQVGVLGFSTLDLSYQELRTLSSYTRRITKTLMMGFGFGSIIGACASMALGWSLAAYEPLLLNAHMLVIEDLLFIPLAMGVLLGIDGLLLVVNFARWRRQQQDARQDIPMPRIRFSLFRPWWQLLAGMSALVVSTLFTTLLLTGVLPTQPIYIPNGANELTIQPPLWLLLAPPIAVAILLLTMEVGGRLLYHMRWPAPTGVAPALAERARQRMRLQMIVMPVVFPFFMMWMLLMGMSLLTQIDLTFVWIFLTFPLMGIVFCIPAYSFFATGRLWKFIPLSDEEKRAE